MSTMAKTGSYPVIANTQPWSNQNNSPPKHPGEETCRKIGNFWVAFTFIWFGMSQRLNGFLQNVQCRIEKGFELVAE